jgi:hypothetical protein
MNTNILLPLKSNSWHDQNTTTDTLDALATLETVKSTIGSRAYSLIIENCDLATLVRQCRDKVRGARPGTDQDALKGPDRGLTVLAPVVGAFIMAVWYFAIPLFLALVGWHIYKGLSER